MRPAGMLPKYDGPTRTNFEAYEEREELYALDRGICQGCGRPVEHFIFQVAHKIAETKENIHRYGWDVIDSIHNKAIAHPWCNSKLNCGHNPAACAEIVAKVRGE